MADPLSNEALDVALGNARRQALGNFGMAQYNEGVRDAMKNITDALTAALPTIQTTDPGLVPGIYFTLDVIKTAATMEKTQ